jgi:ketosteroid isomerase-like protein
MRWLMVLVVFVTTAMVSGQSSSSIPSHAADEQTIRGLNLKWLKAFDDGNANLLDQMEGDDFTVSGHFGNHTKQEQLQMVRSLKEKLSPPTRKIENQQFRFYGDTALVTETDYASSSDGSSTNMTTTLWVRRDGVWKVVHLHFTPLDTK